MNKTDRKVPKPTYSTVNHELLTQKISGNLKAIRPKAIRLDQNLSQPDLAGRAGISRRTITLLS